MYKDVLTLNNLHPFLNRNIKITMDKCYKDYLFLEVRESCILIVYIYIFCVVVSYDFLLTLILYQVSPSNTNDLYTVIWFHVCLPNSKDYMVYILMIILIVIWF